MDSEQLTIKEHEAGLHSIAPSGKSYSAWKFMKVCPECYKKHQEIKQRSVKGSNALSEKSEVALEKLDLHLHQSNAQWEFR